MNDVMRQQVRQVLLNQVAVAHKSTGWLGRVVDWVFGAPADATYVFEYAACDAGHSNPTGPIERSWFINGEGVHEVDPSPDSVPNERRGMWYRFNRLHFYLSPDGDWVVKARTDGPRAGCGGCFRVVPKGNKLVLVPDGSLWKC